MWAIAAACPLLERLELTDVAFEGPVFRPLWSHQSAATAAVTAAAAAAKAKAAGAATSAGLVSVTDSAAEAMGAAQSPAAADEGACSTRHVHRPVGLPSLRSLMLSHMCVTDPCHTFGLSLAGLSGQLTELMVDEGFVRQPGWGSDWVIQRRHLLPHVNELTALR